MYGGKLRNIKFKYTGPHIEAVLDRLPTAQVLEELPEGGQLVEAEVFDGNGLDMWLRSQGAVSYTHLSLGFDDMAGMLEATLRQNGSDYVNEEGAQFNTEAGQQALDFIMEMYNNDYARLVGEDNYFSGPFSNQLIPAYVGSSTGVSYITHEGWELGVAPLPGNTEKAANTAGTNIVMSVSYTHLAPCHPGPGGKPHS